jgi:hypothetical protein
MRKVLAGMAQKGDSEMRAEYDFTGGVRSKHFRAMQSGYTVTVHRTDGSTLVTEVMPKEGLVVLAPDVQEYFPDSDSVNAALRGLIQLIPDRDRTIAQTKISNVPE